METYHLRWAVAKGNWVHIDVQYGSAGCKLFGVDIPAGSSRLEAEQKVLALMDDSATFIHEGNAPKEQILVFA